MDEKQKPAAGWAENMEWNGDKEIPPETTGSRVVSYTALVVLAAGLLGLAFAAFPYVMGFVTTYATSSRHHSWDPHPVDVMNWWIQDDTHARAWWRFALGAFIGAAGSVAYLVWGTYQEDAEEEKKNLKL